MRVLIAAGGTAGHINPALAIAGALKKADPTAEIHFAGRKEGMEYRLVTQAGYPFHHIEITGFQRKLSLHNIKRNIITLWNLALSGPKAKAMMKEVKPDLVIGCGGYVSGPVVRCAAKMGIHTALHEQNAFPGVTNKLLAPDVDIVFAAVPAAVEKLGAPDKTLVVGNPVRPEVFAQAANREAIRAQLGAGDRTVILSFGGSLARTQATGYGLLYLTEEMLRCNGKDLKGKTVVVSGAGNVATYAIEKAWQLGAKPVTCSDSTGWIYDPDGIDVATLIEVKQVKRARLTEYAKARPNAVYHEGKGVWSVKCDVALPCATQNELLLDDAKALVANGCFAVCEGANMPTSLDATEYLQDSGVLFVPGKASNAGGVATSALEMTQNSERLSWTFEEVDAKLKDIMVNIFHNLDNAAKEYGMEGNYVAGANIAGFLKVADAMQSQGIV